MIANALGTPPEEVVREVQATGRLVGALCGRPDQAQHHKDAGLDFVIAQGTEGGGHTGEIGSLVLWPQVVETVAPIPVLAAGGIGTGAQIAAALAVGCQGAWTGSLWLTVEEASTSPAQKQQLLDKESRDTIRSKSFTGKPCRMIRNDWTDAWERPDTPDPLPMPMQYMVSGEAVARGSRYPEQSRDVFFNPVGQTVGLMKKERKARDLMTDLVEEYLEACERLERVNAAAGQ
jgi:NAD(P)H-dependent flavin oxidoreductase YrpB (nitropropane dioxygenase family)